ncbi:hypothetical protein RG903_12080 [Thermithiobacillus tepidarius DSM 3134]|uniref:hypothetical protein n=1 Tax=Thermithiobacillus tepidarius TaxID=929 RepID=UPI000420D936|nr:hypothetical protein [Thermithiobacillus tepidarius]
MDFQAGTCPLTRRQLADTYFIENRTRILEIAAFLDRLDRAADGSGDEDFRIQALREALRALSSPTPGRVQAIQMLFSDPDLSLLDMLDQKSADGAPAPRRSGVA